MLLRASASTGRLSSTSSLRSRFSFFLFSSLVSKASLQGVCGSQQSAPKLPLCRSAFSSCNSWIASRFASLRGCMPSVAARLPRKYRRRCLQLLFELLQATFSLLILSRIYKLYITMNSSRGVPDDPQSSRLSPASVAWEKPRRHARLARRTTNRKQTQPLQSRRHSAAIGFTCLHASVHHE